MQATTTYNVRQPQFPPAPLIGNVQERMFLPVQTVLNNLLGFDGACPDWESDQPLAEWLVPGDSTERTAKEFTTYSRITAQACRASMESLAPTHICAVCSCFVSSEQLHPLHIPVARIPHIEMLQKACTALAADDECPRSGHTMFEHDKVAYCLQPNAISDGKAAICTECYNHLEHSQIPPSALVRLDPRTAPQLPELTYLETILLAIIRVHRHTIMLRCNSHYTMKPDDIDPTLSKGLRGHVIAFPNPSAASMTKIFPYPLAELPKLIQVCVSFKLIWHKSVHV